MNGVKIWTQGRGGNTDERKFRGEEFRNLWSTNVLNGKKENGIGDGACSKYEYGRDEIILRIWDTIIQGDLEGQVNVLRGNSIGHWKKEILYGRVFLIVNSYRNRAVWI
jgi:hypothetical protein